MKKYKVTLEFGTTISVVGVDAARSHEEAELIALDVVGRTHETVDRIVVEPV